MRHPYHYLLSAWLLIAAGVLVGGPPDQTAPPHPLAPALIAAALGCAAIGLLGLLRGERSSR